MSRIVAFLSQKGGVGKSTLARALAREGSNSGLSVKLADLDTQQGTVSDWHRQRLNNGHIGVGSVEVFRSAREAIEQSGGFDLIVIDGAARASQETLEIARASDTVVLPACASRDDLMPAVKLANELRGGGIPRDNIAFALCRVSTVAEIADAREFIEHSGYRVLAGALLEKPAYRQAQNGGLSITETRFSSLNQKADELLEDLTILILST